MSDVRVCSVCGKKEHCRCDEVCRFCGGEFKIIDLEEYARLRDDNGN